MAAKLGHHDLEHVLALAESQSLTTPAELQSLIARHPTSPGVCLLEALLHEDASPGITKSEAENRRHQEPRGPDPATRR